MTDTITTEKAQLESIVQRIVDKRREYNAAIDAINEVNEELRASVADIDAQIEALQEQRTTVIQTHPLAAKQAALVDESQFADEEYRKLCAEAIDGWCTLEKTLPVKGGKVTKSTRKGVDVTDTRAAAEALLRRELWAYVKDLKVDVAGIRPLLDVEPGVPGIEPADKESISVKLEA